MRNQRPKPALGGRICREPRRSEDQRKKLKERVATAIAIEIALRKRTQTEPEET